MLIATNLFGDILSDEVAGLVGGLGLAPGANIGADTAKMAQQIRKAVDQTLLEDKIRTGDLGDKASTAEYARAIVRRLS